MVPELGNRADFGIPRHVDAAALTRFTLLAEFLKKIFRKFRRSKNCSASHTATSWVMHPCVSAASWILQLYAARRSKRLYSTEQAEDRPPSAGRTSQLSCWSWPGYIKNQWLDLWRPEPTQRSQLPNTVQHAIVPFRSRRILGWGAQHADLV